MSTTTNQLTISGRITEIGSAAQGENWQKQDFTIETSEPYVKLVNIHVWNDKIEMLNRCRVGDVVICRINISSRKHENRYYTEVTAWKVEVNLYKKTKTGFNEFEIEEKLTNPNNWKNDEAQIQEHEQFVKWQREQMKEIQIQKNSQKPFNSFNQEANEIPF